MNVSICFPLIDCLSSFLLGGIVGSMVGMALKERQNSLYVFIVEEDQTYRESSTTLSVGGNFIIKLLQNNCDAKYIHAQILVIPN